MGHGKDSETEEVPALPPGEDSETEEVVLPHAHQDDSETKGEGLMVYAGIPMRGTEDLNTFLPVIASIKYQTYPVDFVIAGVSGRKAVDSVAMAVSLVEGAVLEDLSVPASVGASRNLVFRTAHENLVESGGVLIFGDSDDAWHPRRVEAIVQAFIDNPKAAAVVANYAYDKSEFCKWNNGSLEAYTMQLTGTWSDGMYYALEKFEHARVDPGAPWTAVAHGPIAIRAQECTSALKWSTLVSGEDREFMFRVHEACGRDSILYVDAPLICYKCMCTSVVARVLDGQAQQCSP